MKHKVFHYGMWDQHQRYFTKKEVQEVLDTYHATQEEKDAYFQWVFEGHSFYENPYMIYDEKCQPFNFIESYRMILDLMEEYENDK